MDWIDPPGRLPTLGERAQADTEELRRLVGRLSDMGIEPEAIGYYLGLTLTTVYEHLHASRHLRKPT